MWVPDDGDPNPRPTLVRDLMGTLDGVRVLEAGLLVQGPQASLTMLEWGAEVIKVELPGFGDQSRWLPIRPRMISRPLTV